MGSSAQTWHFSETWGDYGKIPDFKGSMAAALRLSKTGEWKKSLKGYSRVRILRGVQ